jgi:hypothetical protein
MRHIAVAFVAGMLALPALADDDKPKEKAKDKAKATQSVPAVPLTQKGGGGPEAAKPGTPAAEYQALVKEYSVAERAFWKAYQEANDEDKPKLYPEKYAKLTQECASKLLELAEKNPKAPVAADALVWIVEHQNGRPPEKNSPRAKAIAILMRDYITSEKIGGVCNALGYQIHEWQTEPLLRAILEKNPSQSIQAEACLALAQGMRQLSQLVRQLESNPTNAATYEQAFGKEYLEELRKKDAAKIEAEADVLYGRFADKYVPSMKPERLANLFQNLSYSTEKSGEKLLRLLEKDKRREVKGVATLTLAQVLKRQADAQPGDQGEQLRKESEALFEQAIEKYGDVQMQYYGTVGKKAKGELHALRFLAVGKPAPEVEGVDQDGKKFKLSDYKGKVVLLDFWSQY